MKISASDINNINEEISGLDTTFNSIKNQLDSILVKIDDYFSVMPGNYRIESTLEETLGHIINSKDHLSSALADLHAASDQLGKLEPVQDRNETSTEHYFVD